MIAPRCAQAPAGAAADTARHHAAQVPVLDGARLRLRAPHIDDLPAWTDILTGADLAHVGGPYDAESAYEAFCTYAAGWLLHGHGLWSVERLSDGFLLGFVQLGLEWDDVEPELGWMFRPNYRGQGYASEAAALARAYGEAALGSGAFVSYIAARNTPSAALAARLGAQRDVGAEAAIGEPDLQVWRHGGPL